MIEPTHLMIGDVHVRPDDLEDCEHLMRGVVETLDEHPEIQEVWLLGDLHHTHAWVHVDVQAFWKRWLVQLAARVRVNIVVGNHDLAPSGNHAMQWFTTLDNVVVFDETASCADFDVLPYMSKDAFVEAASQKVEDVLICHQTFAGAQFENGFYAPEGVDASRLPYRTIIAGHIHEPQVLVAGEKRVVYLGSPRWISLNDANSERFIYLVEVLEDGEVEMEKISTAQWCKVIRRVEVSPETTSSERALDITCKSTDDEYHFDLRGPKTWCEDTAKLYSRYGKVRTFPEQSRVVHVRESEGVFQAFRKFVDTYTPPNATPMDRIKSMVEERFRG